MKIRKVCPKCSFKKDGRGEGGPPVPYDEAYKEAHTTEKDTETPKKSRVLVCAIGITIV